MFESSNRSGVSLILAVTAGFVFLPNCSVGPDYRKAEPSAPASWSRLDKAGEPITHPGTPSDLSQWWRSFNDTLLSELVGEALLSGFDSRTAQARLRQARAKAGVAGSAYFPEVNTSGSARHSRSANGAGGTNSQNLFKAGFDASWELDVFGGVRRGVEAAEADEQSALESLRNTQVTLAGETSINYIEVRALQIRLGIARNNLASQSETLQLTSWRAQAGLTSSQDVEQARSNREQTLAQIPTLEMSLAETEHRLDILLGKPPGTLHARLAEGGDLPALPPEVAVGIPADTLRQRPDVRAAERSLAAETARVGVAEAARYPSFSLSGSIGLEALVGGALGNSSGFVYSLLGGITAPIFNAGRLRNLVEAQDAVREQAQIRYEQTVLNALQEVENALVRLDYTRERSEALTRAAEAARNAALIARQRYGAGVTDFQSVLDTERSVLSVEDNLASTRADEVLALIQLYKALGGGWSPPEKSDSGGREDAP